LYRNFNAVGRPVEFWCEPLARFANTAIILAEAGFRASRSRVWNRLRLCTQQNVRSSVRPTGLHDQVALGRVGSMASNGCPRPRIADSSEGRLGHMAYKVTQVTLFGACATAAARARAASSYQSKQRQREFASSATCARALTSLWRSLHRQSEHDDDPGRNAQVHSVSCAGRHLRRACWRVQADDHKPLPARRDQAHASARRSLSHRSVRPRLRAPRAAQEEVGHGWATRAHRRCGILQPQDLGNAEVKLAQLRGAGS